jgi:hypothetical protein
MEKRCFSDYTELIENNISKNPKQFWTFVKSRSNSFGIPSSVRYGNDIMNSGIDICNAFSEYFKTSFLDPGTSTTGNSLCNVQECTDSVSHIAGISVDNALVTKLLLNLDPSKSAGPDQVPALYYINCAKALTKPISLLFRRSFAESTVPAIWKSAFITPVIKKGPKTDVTNYRPISKLCIVAKVLEKIVHAQVSSVLKNSIDSTQHGFVQHRSTVSNLALLNDFISESMDSGHQVDVIYTDYSKAFDRIDHDILISKLYLIGIRGDLLRWFKSYIKNRCQSVVISNYMSSWVSIPSGVPQGSLLGPLLFNIFVNDIRANFQYSRLLSFADDMKIFAKIVSISDAYALQSDLSRLDSYCVKNKLDLNPSKCFTVTFSRSLNVISTPYSLKGNVLKKVASMRDLGVIHDSKLIFDEHIDSIVCKAAKSLGFIMRSSACFTRPKTLKILYCAYVRSRLEYASQIWNPQYQIYVDRIERLQTKFIRFLCYKMRVNYSSNNYYELCRKHHLIPLVKRRAIADIVYLVNIIKGNVDCPNLLSKISLNVPTRRFRKFRPISIYKSRTKYRKNSLLGRAGSSLNKVLAHLDFDIFNDSITVIRNKLVGFYMRDSLGAGSGSVY